MAKPDERFDRVSIWHDGTGDLYNIGCGRIYAFPDDDKAVINVNWNLAKRREVPQDLSGYKILASKDGSTVYEGEVNSRQSTHDMDGRRLELHCWPDQILSIN